MFLQPSLRAGFRGDDTWTSLENAEAKLFGEGLFTSLWHNTEHFVRDSGRPQPLGPLQGGLTSAVIDGHEFAYHLFLLALTVAAAGLLYSLVRELGLSRSGALLTITVLAGAIQFRSYHDATLGYWGTTQLMLILTEASLLFFIRGLRRGDKRLLVASFLLFLPCPLLYEIAYPLVVLYPAVALFERRGWDAIRVSLPFLVLAAVFVAISIYGRASAPSVVPGYEVGSSPWAALRTFVVQLFTPLPASNVFFRADYGTFFPLGTHPTKAEFLGAAWRGAVVFVLVVVLSLRLVAGRRASLPSPRVLWALAAVGALLWTTSVLTISIAPKYQAELVPGKGYLTALIQTFGWALVATSALLAALRAAAQLSLAAVRIVAVAGAGMLSFAAAIVGFNNMRVIALETPVVQTRELLDDALGSGVIATLPRRSTVLFSPHDFMWQTGNLTQYPPGLDELLLQRSGREYDARILPPPDHFSCRVSGKFPPQGCEPPAGRSAWVRVRAWPGGGAVFLGAVPAGAANEFAATTRDLRVFVRSDGGKPGPERLVGRTAKNQPWSSDGLDWQPVSAGGDWAIYSAHVDGRRPPVASTLDDPNGRLDFQNLGAPDQIVRVYGTKRLLP